MEPYTIYSILEGVTRRSEPFSEYTANELWTDEHTSGRMLAFHLDGDVDISSRRTAFIDESVSWMAERFSLGPTSRVIDFGCGPGLYTSRFDRWGADVYGLDFSPRSIEYAQSQAAKTKDRTTYIETDYLVYQPEGSYDLITMIMCDFCALAPTQRSGLLEKFSGLLSPGGRVVLDVYSMRGFECKQETLEFEENLMNGFWSADTYFGFVSSFKYEEDKVSLDKYTIVERNRLRTVYNWLQYFFPKALEREVRAAGLEVDEFLGDVAGRPYDADATEFAVVLKRAEK